MALRFLILIALPLVCMPASAEVPQWLVEARAQEGRLIMPKRLRSPDGFFRAAAPAQLVGKVAGADKAYAMQFDIGASAPIHCEVISGGFDPAALLRATAEVTFSQLEAVQGKIGQREIDATDAGALDGHPFLSVDWLYTVEVGGELQLGLLKQLAVLVGAHGLYCSHIELGYSDTFRSVVAALATTLAFKEPAAKPYYSEVHTASMMGRRFGTTSISLTRDEDGDIRRLSRTSMVLAVTPDTLTATDIYQLERVRPDGSLINGMQVVVENGELATRLQLSPAADQKWQVEGQYMHKELSKLIETSEPPGTWLAFALAKRNLLASGAAVGNEIESVQWIGEDPTRFHVFTSRVLAKVDDGKFAGRESVAGMVAEVVMDATGSNLSAQVDLEPQVVQIERVHVQGSF